MSITINSVFDGGNISVVRADMADDVHLQIKHDAGDQFFQWFYFRMTTDILQRCVLHIDNAGQSSYPKGWEDYRVVASYDREHWFRVPTAYSDGVLSFEVAPSSNTMWFAYFTPYSMERHQKLIAQIALNDNAHVEVVGHTVQGRSLDLLRIGDPAARYKIWAIARQHPGETMAQWWMEGYLNKLVNPSDAIARELRQRCVFYVVPNMNPDGCFLGYLRTNAAGCNLNREWDSPSLEHSPEVFYVRQKMQEIGVDFNLDVHGDEALPYNFIAGTEGIESWSAERLALQDLFKSTLQSLNPDFQTIYGYPATPANTANYGICSNYIAQNFACPAMTLEMPFRDTIDSPDALYGWSAERAALLGESCVNAIHTVIGEL